MARSPVRLSSKEGSRLLEQSALSSSLAGLGLHNHLQAEKSPSRKGRAKKSTNMEPTEVEDAKAVTKSKPKRKGVSTAPILKSLDSALPVARWSEDSLVLEIPGGRILTYNELYSILQFRKYEAFRYKKICRGVIQRALNAPSSEPKPYFDGPTRLTLLRVGTKEMDLDALPVVFKYFLDSLKSEGIIADDNPNIIVDIELRQAKGDHRLGMKLERLHNWARQEIPDQATWLAI